MEMSLAAILEKKRRRGCNNNYRLWVKKHPGQIGG